MIETIGLLIFSIPHSNWRFMIARHFSIASSRSQSRYVNASPSLPKLLQSQPMSTPKILIADSISQSGVDELARDGQFEVSTQTGLKESELIKIDRKSVV